MARKPLPWGVQAELSRLAGIAPQNLGAILRGKRRATIGQARTLEAAGVKCGLHVSRLSWLYPTEYTNAYLEDGRPDETAA